MTISSEGWKFEDVKPNVKIFRKCCNSTHLHSKPTPKLVNNFDCQVNENRDIWFLWHWWHSWIVCGNGVVLNVLSISCSNIVRTFSYRLFVTDTHEYRNRIAIQEVLIWWNTNTESQKFSHEVLSQIPEMIIPNDKSAYLSPIFRVNHIQF